MSYLLDTNIVSFYLRGNPNVVTRLKSEKPSNIAISAISAFELRYGVAKRKSPKLKTSVDGFLSLIFIVPFDDDAALRAGTLKSGPTRFTHCRTCPLPEQDTCYQ